MFHLKKSEVICGACCLLRRSRFHPNYVIVRHRKPQNAGPGWNGQHSLPYPSYLKAKHYNLEYTLVLAYGASLKAEGFGVIGKYGKSKPGSSQGSGNESSDESELDKCILDAFEIHEA